MSRGRRLPRKWAPFRAFLEAELGPAVEVASRDPALLIDRALTAAGAKPELCATIARAGPYGSGNPEPVFALPSHTLAHADEVGQGHVRVRLKARDGASVQAIAPFARRTSRSTMRCSRTAGTRFMPVHAAGCLTLDSTAGRARIAPSSAFSM